MKKLILALFLLTSLVSSSQSDFGDWLIYFGNKKINNKWNIHHEIQYRNYNAIGDLEQLLIRGGLGYNLTENNNNILLGYGYILSENYINTEDKVQVNEHRIYQQFITKQQFGRFNISHRYRLEERFVESVFKLRFRYFLSCKVALNNSKLQKKTFYLSAYNELFIGSKSPQFDRNRLYGGLGYQHNSKLKFEAGYMNQFFSSSNRDQLNLIVAFNF